MNVSVRRLFRSCCPLCAVAACVFATPALASEALSDSNAALQSLAGQQQGRGARHYRRTDGKVRRVLVWGAVNANIPGRPGRPAGALQVRLRRRLGQVPQGHLLVDVQEPCAPYDGPPLATSWRVQGARRHVLGGPVVAARPAPPRLRSLAAASRRRSSSTSRTGTASSPKLEVYTHWTYGGRGRALFGRSRTSAAGLRLRLDGDGNPQRPLRPERLYRHFQFRLRAGLEARVGHPRPQAERHLLSQLRPAEAVPGLPEPGDAPAGTRRAVPRSR